MSVIPLPPGPSFLRICSGLLLEWGAVIWTVCWVHTIERLRRRMKD